MNALSRASFSSLAMTFGRAFGEKRILVRPWLGGAGPASLRAIVSGHLGAKTVKQVLRRGGSCAAPRARNDPVPAPCWSKNLREEMSPTGSARSELRQHSARRIWPLAEPPRHREAKRASHE